MTRVKVMREPAGSSLGQWRVLCGDCTGTDLWSAFARPVIRCASWTDAMWWAGWHKAEHDRLACPTCNHREKLPPVEVLDSKAGTVSVGGRVFGRVPGKGFGELVHEGSG